jgi:hypothetical protein
MFRIVNGIVLAKDNDEVVEEEEEEEEEEEDDADVAVTKKLRYL